MSLSFFFFKATGCSSESEMGTLMGNCYFGNAITGFLSALNHFWCQCSSSSFLLVVSLCSCHCLLTPAVSGEVKESDRSQVMVLWSRCRAERKQEAEIAEEFLERLPMYRHLPWINNWRNEADTPTLLLDLSTHRLNTSHTFRGLPSPVISLRPIFLLFRGTDSACCCFSSLKNFPTIFSVQWLSGCLSRVVSFTVTDFKSIGTHGMEDVFRMMDM